MKFLSKSCFQLTMYKAYAELQAESERTYAGFVWWILDPIFTLTVYYLVFQGVVSRGSENFVIFLCVGIVTWRWMQNTVMQSSTSILAGGGLMQQVYLPKIVFPTAIILSDFFQIPYCVCFTYNIFICYGMCSRIFIYFTAIIDDSRRNVYYWIRFSGCRNCPVYAGFSSFSYTRANSGVLFIRYNFSYRQASTNT
ncbi:MAG: hypothetical protein P9M03_10185 [Candidatus Theseobacter exili]|nr:hypothetical protein [Candidatus Theseobacter exili]